MPLTPQDVRNKLFTSVRLRPGYDEDEVDAFLDEVEHELGRLHAEIEELKGGKVPASDLQLATARQDAETRMRAALDDAGHRHAQELASLRSEHEQAIASTRTDAESRAQQQVAAATQQTEQLRQQAEARLAQAAQQAQAQQQQVRALQVQAQQFQEQAAQVGQELARVRAEVQAAPASPTEAAAAPVAPPEQVASPATYAPGGSVLPPPSPTEDALRRTLLLAQRTADEAVAEARTEAQRIVGDAQRHAAETTRRAESEHASAMAKARSDYEELATKVDELRGFERDYRSRLRAYLRLQLRDLEAGAPEPPPSVAAPTRSALPEGYGNAPQPSATEVQHSASDDGLRPPPLYGNGQLGPESR